MRKALYVPCYSGELGWEIINYVPYINHLVSINEYNEIHIVVREGREGLYPMGTRWYPIKLSSAKSMGNSGPPPPPNKIANKLKKAFEVAKASLPSRGMRYIKRRKFLKYEADPEVVKKWGLPNNAATLCIRGRKFGNHKNWSPENWAKLCEHIVNVGYTPVLIGHKETIQFDPPPGCVDIRDRTTISDLIAIFHASKFVAGQSTGPMHLASMCGIPHAVWGSARIKSRYQESWNPHKTVIEYLDCGKGFKCSVKQVIKLINALLLGRI